MVYGSFNFAACLLKSQPLRSSTAPWVSPPVFPSLFGIAEIESALFQRSSFATCASVWLSSCVIMSTSALLSAPLFDFTTSAPIIFIFWNVASSTSQFTNFTHDCTNCSIASILLDCILFIASNKSMTSSISDTLSWLFGYSTIGMPPNAWSFDRTIFPLLSWTLSNAPFLIRYSCVSE